MAFKNTIDKLGDEATLAAILEGTITEYCDDSCTAIKATTFAKCHALTIVDVPNATAIKYDAFSNCTALETVRVPRVRELGNKAFFSGVMATLDLPEITKIDRSACGSCKNLSTLIIRNTEQLASMINVDAFTNTPIASGTGYIYVPRALIEDYKIATNWSTYADQFRALEDYTVDGTTTGELDETKI